jgi:D-sedoheptulose 7-phosphate isomerase
MHSWIARYIDAQKAALDSVDQAAVARLIRKFRETLLADRQIFVCGNGGSASNSSHFATDLGKSASNGVFPATGKRFRVLTLNDNISWITALGNDFSYEDVYLGQLMNYARPEDVVLTLSVSGSSPNLVKACEWAKKTGLYTAALVGGKKGKLAEICDEVLVVGDTHYGRAEDAQMTIAHMLCYAFIEHPEWVRSA